MEEEFVEAQEEYRKKKEEEQQEQADQEENQGANKEKEMITEFRKPPLSLATLEEWVDEDHVIISQSLGPEYYVAVMSFVDKDQLAVGSNV